MISRAPLLRLISWCLAVGVAVWAPAGAGGDEDAPPLNAAPTKLAALAEHVRRDTSALATTSTTEERTGVLPALMFCNAHQMFELRSAVQPTNSYDPLVVGSVQFN